jgi:hypothetical protein
VYGGLAVFGESIEALTGVTLAPEEIDSYTYLAQLADEADHEHARTAANKSLREALQIALAAPDSREIRVNSQQAHLLRDDWLSAQPDEQRV